jgi:hypothetical protein
MVGAAVAVLIGGSSEFVGVEKEAVMLGQRQPKENQWFFEASITILCA